MFKGRKLIIATKHGKEKAIAPIFENELGVECVVLPDLDTDTLGTFTGEVERSDDAIATARKKCLMAMDVAGADLAIASEGSFGPHPSIIFAHADDEILLFLDKANNLEILVRIMTTDTNFNASEISSKKQLKEFAYNAKFPSHGLILKKSKHDFSDMVKGITDWEVISATFDKMIECYGSVYVETDMRAMFNPTRMQVIEKVAQKMVDKIASTCPSCSMPGFGITAIKEGLRCRLCGSPTRSIQSHIYECAHCDFTTEQMFPNGQETEDPMYCDYCNP
jgi:hypothetical protein